MQDEGNACDVGGVVCVFVCSFDCDPHLWTLCCSAAFYNETAWVSL